MCKRVMFALVLVSLAFHAYAIPFSPLQRGAFAEVFDAFEASESAPAYVDQIRAMALTFVGRQDAVFEYTGRPTLPFAEPCRAGDGTRAQPAQPWLLDAVRDERLVMFNENHYHIAARAYVHELLPALRELGFTHLGIEAAFEDMQPEDGHYVQEPVFAALVRRARELGFEVFGYEPRLDLPADLPITEQFARRESGQAELITAAIERAGDDARFVIFAGWSHILEKPAVGDPDSREWMALRLKRSAAVDPFTVDLTSCVFEGSAMQDGRVLLTSDDRIVVRGHYSDAVDAQVQLPVPHRGAEAPGFYRRVIGDRRPLATPTGYEEVPLLFRARRSSVPGAPIDQMLVQPGEQAVLYLPQGAYTITVQDGSGSVVSRYQLSVAHLGVDG